MERKKSAVVSFIYIKCTPTREMNTHTYVDSQIISPKIGRYFFTVRSMHGNNCTGLVYPNFTVIADISTKSVTIDSLLAYEYISDCNTSRHTFW